ncbi:MAG: DUF1697 domain-containing protein [Oscillospiraceae bacterium]|nr:DUF1697 domain-containing protein [Oscillospiraceae bacterium]
MNRYIALLRGINISGKNKISMPELKKDLADLDFADIKTYLNSGNVIFSSDTHDSELLAHKIRMLIKEKFELDIPVYIILQDELEERLSNAPGWWGDDNKEIYDNLIFMMPPLTYDEFYSKIGDPKEEYEKVHNYKDIIFWSFSRADYRKTNWWSKTASSVVSDLITIRTANTLKKIVSM